MAGCFQTSEWCVDGQPARYLAGKGGGFVVLPGRGHVAGHALWINVVLEANPAHVKALLYRRGMANLEIGDFEEARCDFEMMMKADKSFEPDATAAFKKLKQKQQDVEKKARRKSLMLERVTEWKSRVQMKTTERRMVLSSLANW